MCFYCKIIMYIEQFSMTGYVSRSKEKICGKITFLFAKILSFINFSLSFLKIIFAPILFNCIAKCEKNFLIPSEYYPLHSISV